LRNCDWKYYSSYSWLLHAEAKKYANFEQKCGALFNFQITEPEQSYGDRTADLICGLETAKEVTIAASQSILEFFAEDEGCV
jgi:hypothetical protein